MTPKEVVREWIRRFNDADVDGLAALYAPDAVNHQVVMEPLHGREAIREMFAIEFGRAKMVCIEENLLASGLSWNGAIRSGCADAASFKSGTIRLCFNVATSISFPFSSYRACQYPMRIWAGDQALCISL